MRTSAEYFSDLMKLKANVYVAGERVRRDDPRIMPGIRVMSVTFDLAQNPDWEDLMTATSPLIGKRVNRFTYPPQNPYDLMQKQKMIRLLAQRVGGCIQRCMGCDTIVGLSICTKEMDEKYGTDYHSRFLNFLKGYQENDLTAAAAQTDMKGDRTKRPHEQPDPDAYVHVVDVRNDGIVVRGAKISITMAAYADEIIVVPT
ncbi:MAG: aromatic ring hydroxylase, partial [Dehalococcoidia bacterium]